MIIKTLTLLNLFPLKILNTITSIKLNNKTEIRIEYDYNHDKVGLSGWSYTIQYNGIFGWRYVLNQIGMDCYVNSRSSYIKGVIDVVSSIFKDSYKFYISYNTLRLAMEINKENIETILKLLSEAGVSETGRNSIQIEWENRDKYLEFEIYDDKVTFFKIDNKKIEQGGEIISIQQLVKLILEYNSN
jgi:hypothetical protein